MILNAIYLLLFITTLIYIVIYVKKPSNINLNYFIAYLLAMFLLEITASIVKKIWLYNIIVYNFLTLLEFNFLLLFIKGLVTSLKSRKIIYSLLVIFNIVYIITTIYYIYLETIVVTYNSIASITGSLTISVAVFIYLKDFLNSDKILNYWKTLSFWISFGLLIYHLGTIPFTSIMNFMSNINLDSKMLLIKIQYLLTTLMYCCYIFGALWSQKNLK